MKISKENWRRLFPRWQWAVCPRTRRSQRRIEGLTSALNAPESPLLNGRSQRRIEGQPICPQLAIAIVGRSQRRIEGLYLLLVIVVPAILLRRSQRRIEGGAPSPVDCWRIVVKISKENWRIPYDQSRLRHEIKEGRSQRRIEGLKTSFEWITACSKSGRSQRRIEGSITHLTSLGMLVSL